MAFLYVGSEGTILQASDERVVTLEHALRRIALSGPAVVVSEYAHDGGVTTRIGIFDPRDEDFSVLRSETERQNIQIDPEYLERITECAIDLQGWVVLDANDEVVSDRVRSKEIKQRAIDYERERRG